jgi:hypothetical protein
MKTAFKIIPSKAYSLMLCLFVFISISLSSCLKDSGPDTGSIVSAITIIHASPNSPAFDFVLDNQRILDPTAPDFEYGKRVPYFRAFSGSRLARIYEKDNFMSPLHEVELKLISGNYYSLFIIGAKESLTSLLIEDDVTKPIEGKTKVRFINLSPDAPSLDFNINQNTTLASDKKYKEYTSFQEIEAGSYSASIKSHSGNSINLPVDLDLEDGKIYTVWVKGFVNTEVQEQELGYETITH